MTNGRNVIAEHFARKKGVDGEERSKYASTPFTQDVQLPEGMEIPSWTPDEKAALAAHVLKAVRDCLAISVDGLRSSDLRTQFSTARSIAAYFLKNLCLMNQEEICTLLEKSSGGVSIMVSRGRDAMMGHEPSVRRDLLRVANALEVQFEEEIQKEIATRH